MPNVPLWRGRGVRAVERVDDGAEADERVIDHLAALGLDPAADHESTHFVYLPRRGGADAVAEALDRDGWHASVAEEDNAAWLVTATRTGALTRAVVRDTRSRFEALAAEHGGVYDGWEARTG